MTKHWIFCRLMIASCVCAIGLGSAKEDTIVYTIFFSITATLAVVILLVLLAPEDD